jgi:hypothetical protein
MRSYCGPRRYGVPELFSPFRFLYVACFPERTSKRKPFKSKPWFRRQKPLEKLDRRTSRESLGDILILPREFLNRRLPRPN